MLRVIVHYVPKSVVHMVLTIFYHNFFSYQFSVLFGIILVHIRCPQLFTTVVQNIFHNWCLPLINIFCFFDTPPDFVANHVPITLIRPLFPLCVPPPLWRGHVPKNAKLCIANPGPEIEFGGTAQKGTLHNFCMVQIDDCS